jgi:fatty acid desaturase
MDHVKCSDREREHSISRDLASVQRHLRDAGLAAEVKQLMRRRSPEMALGIVTDWAVLIATSTALQHSTLLLTPLALLVFASRQRALGNALHDASHGNGLSPRLSQWLLAAPLFEDFYHYRRRHRAHHASAGHPERDPDYIAIPAHLDTPALVYLHLLIDFSTWRRSFLGRLGDHPFAQLLRMTVVWAFALGGLGLASTSEGALTFALLWLGSRATTYHAVLTFTELSDHVGCRGMGIFGYTRNSPQSPLGALFHPRNDNYHLAHHLVPRVYTTSLHSLHHLLLSMARYRQAPRCDGYFIGQHPLARAWIGSTSPGGELTGPVSTTPTQ